MTRRLGPTPDDDIGADLEPVWERLASHASAAPAARPELTDRVQGALRGEFDRALRPTAPLRPFVVVRPLVRPASLRSLAAAAALVALLGASVALAGAGVALLQQAPAVVPTPAVEESDEPDGDTPDAPGLILQPPARPGPDGIDDPDEDDGDADADGDDSDDDTNDEDGAEDDEDAAETDEPDVDPSDEPSDSPDDSPDHSPDDDPSDQPEADEPD